MKKLLVVFAFAILANSAVGMERKSRPKKKHVSEGSQVIQLINAITLSDITKINFLLKQGAPINKEGLFGRTPLAIAIGNGNLEVIKILLKNGAHPNLACGIIQERTPLEFAATKGDLNILRILLNYGADPRDQKAITFALLLGNREFAQRLCNILGQEMPILEKVTQEQDQRDDDQDTQPQQSWLAHFIKNCCCCKKPQIEWDDERKYI